MIIVDIRVLVLAWDIGRRVLGQGITENFRSDLGGDSAIEKGRRQLRIDLLCFELLAEVG